MLFHLQTSFQKLARGLLETMPANRAATENTVTLGEKQDTAMRAQQLEDKFDETLEIALDDANSVAILRT
jgi:hypothetical protein